VTATLLPLLSLAIHEIVIEEAVEGLIDHSVKIFCVV